MSDEIIQQQLPENTDENRERVRLLMIELSDRIGKTIEAEMSKYEPRLGFIFLCGVNPDCLAASTNFMGGLSNVLRSAADAIEGENGHAANA